MRWTSAMLVQCLLTAVCSADDNTPVPVSVTAAELGQYWLIAPERTAPVMPPLVSAASGILRQRGRVTLDCEVTINENGDPVDFQFKSIEPADVDPKPFIARVMFFRYRPAPDNAQRQPVRVHGPQRFFIPENMPDRLPGQGGN